jgi:hypothetical protein
MTHQLQSDNGVKTLDQFPREKAPPRRRTAAEKARILAHLVLQLVALNKVEGQADGNT